MSESKKCVLEIVRRDDPRLPWAIRLVRDEGSPPFELAYSPVPIEVRHADEPASSLEPSDEPSRAAVRCALKHADEKRYNESIDALALKRLAEEVRRLRASVPPAASLTLARNSILNRCLDNIREFCEENRARVEDRALCNEILNEIALIGPMLEPSAQADERRIFEMYRSLAVGVSNCPHCHTCKRNAEESLSCERDHRASVTKFEMP